MRVSCRQENDTNMVELMTRLYPICRSITGEGVRQTLRILQEQIPLEIHEVPTGTQVFDWAVPKEWNIKDAWIKNSAGERLIDFRKLNLHVVSYSVPVRERMKLAELRDHLHTLTKYPDWVPYRTSYYKETWGFCLSEKQLAKFNRSDDYDICIDSSLANGSLTYGEYFIKGKLEEEILVHCHVCHPSLANDNLSGIVVAVKLAQTLVASARRYSYRFLFLPGTIGAITWLSRNENTVPKIRHGVVLTCIGDAGNVTYKRSRLGTAEIDRAFIQILKQSGSPHRIIDFSPYGYDERQYCSPGFNLPVGVMMRSRHGEFPEYHTSADNLDFVTHEALDDSFSKLCDVIEILEGNRTYVNLQPRGEPQLGRRGLYGMVGGENKKDWEMAILWVLNLSDGGSSLLDIAERSDLPFSLIHSAADALAQVDLLREV
jgi:aminopeptidase-like protein